MQCFKCGSNVSKNGKWYYHKDIVGARLCVSCSGLTKNANIAITGKKKSEIHRKRLSDSHKGFKPKYETRLKMSISQNRRNQKMTVDNKQKLIAANTGRKITEETRLKMRKAKLGKKSSLETRKKLSKIRKGRIHGPLSIEHRKKLSEAHLTRINIKRNTSIELKLQSLLKSNNIIHRSNIGIYGRPDIYIEPNICIFADGDYWHSRPRQILKDIKVNRTLRDKGYIVLRFSEVQINHFINAVWKEINRFIEQKPLLH